MSQDPSNERIAETFVKVAELLQAQSASPFRVRAWREGAATVRAEARPLAEVFRTDGRAGLEAIPNIDARLANVIIELVRTGHARILDRLQGEVSPTGVFAELPGVGAALAGRINRELGIETLEELERAAHDGRLAALAGFGERRVRAVCDILAARPSRPS